MKKEDWAKKIKQFFIDNPDDAETLADMIERFNEPDNINRSYFSWYDEFDGFRDMTDRLADRLNLPFYFIEYNPPHDGGDYEIDIYTWQKCGKDERARAIRWASDVYIDLTSYDAFVEQMARWSEEIKNNF